MSLVSSFSEKTLTKEFFKNNLQLNTEQNFKYSVNECKRNKNILYLKVAQENEEFDIVYVMVKMANNGDFIKKQMDCSKALDNIFTVRDDNKEVYLCFAKNDTFYPHRNSLENIRTVLKNLAELQANILDKQKPEKIENCEYKVENTSAAVISLDVFKTFDTVYKSDVISRLQNTVDKLLKAGILVKSFANISANNVFITGSDKCVFLVLGPEVFSSPVYDALIFIFALSDENFRQHHLKSLLNLYYQTFINAVKKDATTLNFNINDFENHVKIFLPIVKFEMAKHLILKDKTVEEKNYLEELLNNILYYFKYPQVSYEDCLEAVSKKLDSTKFKLLSYQLVPLDEKNGYLGEYFTLRPKVEYLGKTEEFSMFTKSLKLNNSHLNEVVQSGVSLKEQFFFRTLLPLFKQYGLDSICDFAPECYFDRLNDVIIFDDMATVGYKSFTPDSRVCYDILKLAFSKAAKLHACTIILEDRMSKTKGGKVRLGDIYEDYMKEWLFEIREGLPRTPINVVDSKPGIDELIDTFVDVPKDICQEEFHKRVDGIYEVFLERLTHPAKQFKNVVCHGDLYASNILIKYDQNGKAEDCSIIDFQSLRYAPIAGDIMTLAYSSAKKEVRDKFLDKLLEEYYQEIKRILYDFGVDINEFYTPAEFTECVRYMKPVSIIAALCYNQVTAVPSDRRQEVFFDENKFKYYFFENRKEFINYLLSISEDAKIYLKELIEDLYDVCIK